MPDQMNELRTKIRRCEAAVFKIGLFLAMVLILLTINTSHFHYSLLTGYYLGLASFAVLAESYCVIDSLTWWQRGLSLVLNPLKLLIIGVILFLLVKSGFSIWQIAGGLIICQFAILLTFINTLRLDIIIAEMNKKKAENARS